MHVLRIEHTVPDFENWKRAFASDPLGRKQAGVLRHQVSRSIDDPDYVMIDLEFNSAEEAQRMHQALQELWGRVDVVTDPRGRVAEVIDTEEY